MPTLAVWLGVTLLKGTLVLATALLLGAALRHAPGGARHRLWSVAFAGLLLLPALAVLLPPLPMPATAHTLAAPIERMARWVAPDPTPDSAADPTAPEPTASSVPREAGAQVPSAAGLTGGGDTAPTATHRRGDADGALGMRPDLPSTLLILWLAGFAAALLFLAVGLGRCAALLRRARPLDDADWLRDLEWHRNFFGIRRRVRLLESAAARTPMTGGVWRPVVVVPEGAAGWSPIRRRVVLLHEFVHIRRFDVVRHLAARVGVALYWFHPLAWLAGRSSAIAREQACDEEVLRLGVKPSVYASHLLELAATLNPGLAPAAALPMIQRSQLEKRLMRILATKARPRAAWASALAAGLMIMTAVSASIAAPAAQQPAAPQGVGAAVAPGAAPTPGGGGGGVGTVGAGMPAGEESAPLLAALGRTPGAAPTATAQDSACWEGSSRLNGRFSGTIMTDDRNGVRMVNGVGLSNGDRIIQRWVDDLRLCMRAHGNVDFDDDGTRLAGVGDGGRVVIEAQLGDRLQTLVIENTGNGEEATWQVGGTARPYDAAAQQWRDQMTAALARFGQIMTLRGERSSLRGQISSIRGQRSSLRGQISSIRGQRSSLRGQISSIHGRRSSLNGEISSARGHVSSLRGQISSARGHVSSLRGQISQHRSALGGLQASRYGANQEELAVIEAAQRRHQEAIDEIERQIDDYDIDGKVAEIEAQIATYDLDGRIVEIQGRMSDDDEAARIAAIEAQIAALDVEGKVAEIEAQITALDVEGKVAEIEAEIEALDVDERVQDIEAQLEPMLRELRATIERIGG